MLNAAVVWRLARHDLRLLSMNRKLMASNAAGVGLILLLVLANVRHGSGSVLTGMFVFAILAGAVVTPITVAVYALVGERERRTLEPLLLLPVDRTTLMLGKLAATLLTSAATVMAICAIVAAVASLARESAMPFLFTRAVAYTAAVLAPIAAVLFGSAALVVSSGARDAQTALASSQLLVAPVLIVMLAVWFGAIALSAHFILYVALSLAALSAVALSLASRAMDAERLLAQRGR